MKKDKAYIYESPNGGKTVFRHEIGKPETKELVRMGDDDIDITDDEYNDYLSEIVDKHWLGDEYEPTYTWTDDNDSIINDPEWQAKFKDEVSWADIKRKSKNHPALKEAMDQMIMIYNLSIEHDTKDNDDVPF